jgi:hypothetical protein
MSNVQHLIAACGAMVLLSAMVGVRLVAVRIGEMRAKRIHPQATANSRLKAAHLEQVQASDNFSNLFELPVLFYALVAIALATGQVPNWLVYGAWCFVLLRYAHSAIHCSYNRVVHRLAAFGLSALLLALLWAGFLVTVLGKSDI